MTEDTDQVKDGMVSVKHAWIESIRAAGIKKFILLFGLVVLVFAPISYSHAYHQGGGSDFPEHRDWAIALDQKGIHAIPSYVLAHSGWQFLLVFLRRLFHISFEAAGFLVTLGAIELMALVLLFWYRPLQGKTNWPDWLVILGVLVAAHVYLLWPLDHLMYLGYIGIISYHNPTIILLRPFAIMQFIFVCKYFRTTPQVSHWQIALTALVSIIGTFVKPSLAICILPAAAVFSAYRIFKKEYLNLTGLIFGLGLPTVTVLLGQFFITYYTNDSTHIEFLPFAVMNAYSHDLAWKFLLSILFPLVLLIVSFKDAINDPRMVISWLIFLFGCILTYLFAESGERMLHGNFTWSGEIALVVLFAVSTLYYHETFIKPTRMAKFLAVLWSLHVVFAVIYYMYNIFTGTYY